MFRTKKNQALILITCTLFHAGMVEAIPVRHVAPKPSALAEKILYGESDGDREEIMENLRKKNTVNSCKMDDQTRKQ